MPDRSAPSTPLWQSVRSSKREKEFRSIKSVLRLVRREEERGGERRKQAGCDSKVPWNQNFGEKASGVFAKASGNFPSRFEGKGEMAKSWDKTW